MNMTEYMSGAIERLVDDAWKASFKNPRESAFLLKNILAQKTAAKKRSMLEAQNGHIPPFLIASISARCNLFCKGCYARANHFCEDHMFRAELTPAQWARIFSESAQLGISFILLAGGEPLMRPEVLKAAAGFPQIIFPVFTNGTLIDDAYLELFNKSRNLVPVLSLEGNRTETDERRGDGTHALVLRAMDELNESGIFFGTSVTVTTRNLDRVTGGEFVGMLREKGCKLIFFVEYVPVTASTAELAPTDRERDILSARLVDLRQDMEHMIFLSFPGDEKETGGCLAAGRGFFHINAAGGAEPCPFSPFSDVNLNNCSLAEALQSSLFRKLNEGGFLNNEHDGGCVLFGKEEEVKKLL